MLKYRLPSGIFMALIVLGAIFIDGEAGRALFIIIGGFLAYFGVDEYLHMLDKIELKSFTVITSGIAAVLLVFTVLEIPIIAILTLLIMSVVVGWFMLIIAEDKKETVIKIVTSFSALPLLAFPLYFMAVIYTGDIGGTSGRIYLFFMLLVTKLGDVGAYTVGTISSKIMPGGNHKILPKISPKKSWEGTIGGMIVSVIASIIFCENVPEIASDLGTILFPVLAGILLFIGGFIGDLTESSLKRAVGVKDSGNIIPGMGGALDVIDSLLLNAPLFYLFITFTS
jgi:phosphatidate cytidylyltransferase